MIKMETGKSFLIIGLFAATLWLAQPDVSAQTKSPAGAGGETINTTIVETQPGDETKEEKSLWKLIKSGGLMMLPLAFLALYGFFKAGVQIYVIIFSNKRERDQALIARLNPHVMPFDDLKGEVDSEINLRETAAFPRMIGAALERIYEGKEATAEALSMEGSLQLGRLRRGLKPLQTVVGVAPLLGLIGTVYGMIVAFQGLGAAGGDKVDVLSKGIYEALVTTAAGLTIAIPFLFVYQWLSRRNDEIGENMNRQAAALLEKFYPSVGGEAKQETEAQQSPEPGEAVVEPEPYVT
jgi:biopolymer transport protein ExbB